MTLDQITQILGDEAQSLLAYNSVAVPKEHLYLPSPNFIDQNFALSNRSPQTLRSLAQLFNTGISGRKAFQRPFNEGVALLHAIQDIYLSKDIDIA